MAWVESASATFRARHESEDADDAARVLAELERLRERLAELFPSSPGEVTVILHGSELLLDLAHPHLPVARLLTDPAARRYIVGWFGPAELHVLAPRLLERRASGAPDSRELLMLAPEALYANIVIGTNNPQLPPPFTPGRMLRHIRWAWLPRGGAQYFSGQTAHLRPAIARRLREGQRPAFPPGLRDAALLGGSVFDLLAREEGERACVELACRLHPQGAGSALIKAFRGRSLKHTEAAWQAHLELLASV